MKTIEFIQEFVEKNFHSKCKNNNLMCYIQDTHCAGKTITLKRKKIVLLRVRSTTKILVMLVTLVSRFSIEILSKSLTVFLPHQIVTSNISQLGKMESSLTT